MPPPEGTILGGDKLRNYLDDLVSHLGQPAEARIGFLEDARYPDGTSVAYIAAINEFGGEWWVPERDVTVYRKINERTGDFLKGGRFVKKAKSNFATTHKAKGHMHRQPPRPFFRRMIADKKDGWGPQLGKLLKRDDYNAVKSLWQMAAKIEGDLQSSIKNFVDPALARSTVRKKGFEKPLIDKGIMWQSTGHEVTTGE